MLQYNLGRKQSVDEIWPACHITKEKKNFIKKLRPKS